MSSSPTALKSRESTAVWFNAVHSTSVRDLGSLNGVWVNNERVERQEEMEIGDEVMIGDVVFVVQEVRGSRNEAKEASDDSADESGIRETPLQALPSDKISDDFLLPVDPDPNDSDDILPLVD